jgi:hypothetical protein
MSILLGRVSVVPTWFVVVGLVALSSPPIGVLFLGAVVATSAVIITFVLRRGLNGAGAMDTQRMWHRERDDRAALGLDGDAQDLMRMDSDKG